MKIFKIAAIAALFFTSFFANANEVEIDASVDKSILNGVCNESAPYFDTWSNKCVKSCPANRFVSETNKLCMGITCKAPTAWYNTANNSCVAQCSKGTISDKIRNKCVKCSGAKKFYDREKGECIAKCVDSVPAIDNTCIPIEQIRTQICVDSGGTFVNGQCTCKSDSTLGSNGACVVSK